MYSPTVYHLTKWLYVQYWRINMSRKEPSSPRYTAAQLQHREVRCAEDRAAAAAGSPDCGKHRVHMFDEDSVQYDIPLAADGPELYAATSGHFVNHSFRKWHALIGSMEHPRHGIVPVIRLERKVAAGEEILAHYNLHGDEGGEATRWYEELRRSEEDQSVANY